MPVAVMKSRLFNNPRALSFVGGLRRPDPRLLSTYVRSPLRVRRIFRVLWKPRRKSSIQSGGGRRGSTNPSLHGCASLGYSEAPCDRSPIPFVIEEAARGSQEQTGHHVVGWSVGAWVLSLQAEWPRWEWHVSVTCPLPLRDHAQPAFSRQKSRVFTRADAPMGGCISDSGGQARRIPAYLLAYLLRSFEVTFFP
jgi:hypothetical protein